MSKVVVSIVDNTKSAYKAAELTSSQSFKLGGGTALSRGRKFVLLPGFVYDDPFINENGDKISVLKLRAMMLTSNGAFTGLIEGIRINELYRETYGKVMLDDKYNPIPAPEIGTTRSRKGFIIPETRGATILDSGWSIVKKFLGKDEEGNPRYNGYIEEPQAFEVISNELHWYESFNYETHNVNTDDNGNVVMKPKLCAIIKRIEMPADLEDYIQQAAL